MSQPPFDFGMRALADFWGQAGKAAAEAQGAATQTLATMAGMMAPPSTQPAPPPDGGQLTEAAKAVSDLWQAAVAMSGLLSSTAAASKGMDPTVEATFRAIADPRSWFASASGLDSVMARVGEGAQLADLGNTERQQAHLMQTWLEVRRRVMEHNAVVLDAWLRAGGAFTTAAAAQAQQDGQPLDGPAMLALWATAANGVLLEAQRSERFLQTQAAMIRAGAELRLAQRGLAEQWAQQFDMPSRTEMDDVHRTVTELRRELRALRRETQDAAAKHASAATQAAATQAAATQAAATQVAAPQAAVAPQGSAASPGSAAKQNSAVKPGSTAKARGAGAKARGIAAKEEG